MIQIGLQAFLITHLVILFSLKTIPFPSNSNNNNNNNNPNNLEHKHSIIHLNSAKSLQRQTITNSSLDNSNNNNHNNNSKCQIFNKILILILILGKMDSLDNLIFNKISDLIKMIMMRNKIQIIVVIRMLRIINIQIIYLIIEDKMKTKIINSNMPKLKLIIQMDHNLKIQENIKINKEIFGIKKEITKKHWSHIPMRL